MEMEYDVENYNSNEESSGPANEWSRTKINQLIELYKSNPCLYNPALKAYKTLAIRKEALNEIARIVDMPVEMVQTKLHGLRTCYRREWSIRERDINGEPISNWKHFSQLKFLDPYFVNRFHFDAPKRDCLNVDGRPRRRKILEVSTKEETLLLGQPITTRQQKKKSSRLCQNSSFNGAKTDFSEEEKDGDDDDDDDEQSPNANEIKFNSPDPLAGSTMDDDIVPLTRNSLQNSFVDSDEIFGQFVAAELRLIKDPKCKRYAKLQIQNILCSGRT